MILWANAWDWVVLANTLMGLMQGICWSVSLYIMIDLASVKNKALVIAFNEFVGFLIIGIVTILSSFQRTNTASIDDYEHTFYLGLAVNIVGFIISLALPETQHVDNSLILQRHQRVFAVELAADADSDSEADAADGSDTEMADMATETETEFTSLRGDDNNDNDTHPTSGPAPASMATLSADPDRVLSLDPPLAAELEDGLHTLDNDLVAAGAPFRNR